MFNMIRPLFLVLLLAGCHAAPEATPFPELPVVDLDTVSASRTGATELWVPNSVLVNRGGILGVFIAIEDRARFQMIKPGQRQSNRTQVLSGLTGNESILTGTLTQVHDGSPLALDQKDKP